MCVSMILFSTTGTAGFSVTNMWAKVWRALRPGGIYLSFNFSTFSIILFIFPRIFSSLPPIPINAPHRDVHVHAHVYVPVHVYVHAHFYVHVYVNVYAVPWSYPLSPTHPKEKHTKEIQWNIRNIGNVRNIRDIRDILDASVRDIRGTLMSKNGFKIVSGDQSSNYIHEPLFLLFGGGFLKTVFGH